jgi:predicted P-loop ATPase
MPDDWEEDYNEALEGMTPEQREKLAKARVNVVPITKGKRKPKPPPPPPPGGWPHWLGRLRRDDRGRVIPDLDNVLIALRGEEQLAGAITFDEMRQHSLVAKAWPHVPDGKPGADPPHETGDDDIARLQQWLQRMGLPRIGREIVGQAVEVVAHDHRFHPVRAEFTRLGLIWDGVSRADKWLFTYLGAEAEDDDAIEYVAAIGKMFLIAMVARVFEPGCQADYMLVLEGDQGILKSSACRALAGEWFSDSLPESIIGKDARQHLRGKLLVEISELSAFSKADIEAWKAFITRREERYRPPYGKHDVVEKRQCLFVGTTNEDTYIKDPSGGRRFWPVKCTTIDVEGLANVRDQLLAEAVVRYRRGERWWPTAEDERRFFKPQQEKRLEEDPWLPTIATWIERRAKDVSEGFLRDLGDGRFTVSDVARGCLGFDGESRIGSREQQRLAKIFKALNCPHPPRTGKGRFYLLPPEDETQVTR